MKFEEVLLALRRGEKVRRAAWAIGHSKAIGERENLLVDDLLAHDWEVVARRLTDDELAASWEAEATAADHFRAPAVAHTFRKCAHELRTRKVTP